MKIDLHVHSTYSDGVHTPTELIRMAFDHQVTVLGLADHDCVDGIGEAEEAARMAGIELVVGVELSCEFHERDLHVLGYGFQVDNGGLRELLTSFRDTRQRRGIKIIENLRQMGVDLDVGSVLARSPDGALGRPHIAEELVARGYVGNHAEAFARYLGEHSPAYVKKYKLSPREAVSHIRCAAGLAFIAHPGNYLAEEDLLDELLEVGFDGIETVHPNHTGEDSRRLEAIARKHGLLMCGGTDFHGFAGKDLPIGELSIPPENWLTIKQVLQSRREQ